MKKNNFIVFGPVPSRRLGKSLGINNIPPKICSYSCVYCQLGRTLDIRSERMEFYNPQDIYREVSDQTARAGARREAIDYLAFVPDGEPTMDINLGRSIEMLKPLGIKIAVISNASFIWDKDVREALHKADMVSLKVDAVSESMWHKINRPHKNLKLNKILQGISEFSDNFKGKLITETMLLKGTDYSVRDIENIADYIAGLMPEKSYLSVPIRPPAEKWALPAPEEMINRAYQIFNNKPIRTEYLIGYEGNAFAFTGNTEQDLLSITSVHPMRRDAVCEFLQKAGRGWEVIEKLIAEDKLKEAEYGKNKFYIRKI